MQGLVFEQTMDEDTDVGAYVSGLLLSDSRYQPLLAEVVPRLLTTSTMSVRLRLELDSQS
jgi:hypothetical protein